MTESVSLPIDLFIAMIPTNCHPNYKHKKEAVKTFLDSILLENRPSGSRSFNDGYSKLILFDSVADVKLGYQERSISQLKSFGYNPKQKKKKKKKNRKKT